MGQGILVVRVDMIAIVARAAISASTTLGNVRWHVPQTSLWRGYRCTRITEDPDLFYIPKQCVRRNYLRNDQ